MCLAGMLLPTALFSQVPATGQLSGKLTKDGVGIEGMIVFFNERTGPPPRPDLYFRIPDEVTFTSSDGHFETTLPIGKYYIAAIARKTELHFGPPQRGDVLYLHRDLKTEQRLFTVEKDRSTDIGPIGDASVFTPNRSKKPTITEITGTVIDLNKKPVKGMYVVGFTIDKTGGRPLFVSGKTGRKGRYSLRVYEGGQYFLRARASLGGGPPELGSYIGFYGGRNPMPILVGRGCTVTRHDIQVEKFGGPGQPSKDGNK